MSGSFEQYIRLIEGDIPAELISRESLAVIGMIAGLLPARLISDFIFECRLPSPRPAADLIVRVPDNGGADILSGRNVRESLHVSLLEDVAWERVFSFARHWAERDSLLWRMVDGIWLELDTSEESSMHEHPQPSLFMDPRKNPATSSSGANGRAWIGDIALPLLYTGALRPAAGEVLERCFEALPGGAHLFAIGAMLPRPARPVRLCMANVPSASIPDYLASVGWRGHGVGLAALLKELSPLAARICLDFDLMPGGPPFIGSRIGLECYCSKDEPKRNEQWQDLLDYLVERGLCLSTKRKGMLAYPGYLQEWERRDLWPKHLLDASALYEGTLTPLLVRDINHVKVDYDEGAPRMAKGYLNASIMWSASGWGP